MQDGWVVVWMSGLEDTPLVLVRMAGLSKVPSPVVLLLESALSVMAAACLGCALFVQDGHI